MAEPQHITIDASKLAWQKLLIAFLIGFGSYFLPVMLDVFDSLRDGQDVEFGWAFVGSLISGSVGAGIRYLMMKMPFLNLTPTDKLHSFGGPPPVKVTAVDRDA